MDDRLRRTACNCSHFPHRRHYAVRRKLGRASTSRSGDQQSYNEDTSLSDTLQSSTDQESEDFSINATIETDDRLSLCESVSIDTESGVPAILLEKRCSLDDPFYVPETSALVETNLSPHLLTFFSSSPPDSPSRKSSPGELVIQSENGERRVLRSTPDWSEDAINGDHLWIPTSVSGDLCYLGDQECTKTGPRMKCSACRIVAHISCIPHLNFACRLTFWDGDLRQYRGNTETLHHLVHRRSETGKCQHCSKSFQSKLSFSMKEIVAISCSWCKAAFHNKDTCFNVDRLKETCSLGATANVTVPPSWIVKLPARETFKSSLRKSPRKKDKGSTRRKKEKAEKESKAFIIKAIPSAKTKPILVFINPKSGGNQGAKLMQKFQWLLNPRQVFDLTQGGPRFGLEMFRKVPNVRVLACGGDGTAGWVLSILDQIGFNPAPPVGVLPLGTGNDLARAFGWGGGYTDEPISKILLNMYEAEPVMLDRWELQVEKNTEAPPADDASQPQGKDNLPLNVVNNYFSFGVDAQIALDFHEAREARPQKFNSRLRNKMFYGQAGGKDLLQRKWKDLSEFVTIECDGKDITAKLREHKVHAVLFLNIPSYGGGTHPWNRAAGQDQVTDDRLIEVVGLTTYQLPLLQAGGHGTCLTQCRTARMITRRTIPMQVDGEACRLNPSIITLRHLNQVPILAKRRPGSTSHSAPVVEQIKVQVRQISMTHYEQHHYDKEALQSASTLLGTITIRQDAVLGQIRKTINELLEQSRNSRTSATSSTNGDEAADKMQPDWCFIDSCTAERFFRVDAGQEHLHYITDITTDDLYILEQDSFSSDSQSTVELPDTHLEDVEPGCEVGESQSNGRALSEDAGVDEMIDLANSQLDDCDGSRPPAVDSQNPPPESSPADRETPTRMAAETGEISPTPQFASVTAESPLLEQASDLIIKAAKAGDIKKLRDLHGKGYSLLSIDSAGQTALHWAARHGHSNVIKYLLAQAPPTLRDMLDSERGQSALHKAAEAKQHTACTMLVASGANLFVADHEGLTPLDLARRAADDDLVAYFESQELFQRNHPEDVETQV